MTRASGGKRATLTAAAIAAALSGCAVSREASEKISATAERAEAALAAARDTTAAAPALDGVTVHGGAMTTGRIVRHGRGDPLPSSWPARSLTTARPVTLHQIAEQLSHLYGVPVVTVDGADQAAGSPPRLLAAAGGSPEPVAPPPQPPLVPTAAGGDPRAKLIEAANGAFAPSGADLAARRNTDTRTVHTPVLPARELFDAIAAVFDVDWRHVHGRIEFYRFVSESFVIEALPLNIAAQAGGNAATGTGAGDKVGAMSGAGGAGALSFGSGPSGGNGSGVSGTQTLALTPFDAFREQLQTVLPGDSRFAFSPSTGRLAVVARPAVMERVRELVALENRVSSRDVLIVAEVVAIDVRDDEEFGFDPDIVFNAANGLKWSANGANPPLASPQAAGSIGTGIVTDTQGAARAFTGTSAALKALSEARKGTQVRTYSGRGQSNTLIQMRRVRETDVIRATQTIVVPNSGTVTNTQTSTLTAGLELVSMPRILPDGRLRLWLGLSVSSLVDIINEQLGPNNRITRAVRDASDLAGTYTLRSGDSIVMTGFMEADASKRDVGTGTPWNIILGGGRSATVGRRQFVVIITPVEI